MKLRFTKRSPPLGRFTTKVQLIPRPVNPLNFRLGTPPSTEYPRRIILLRDNIRTQPLSHVQAKVNATLQRLFPWKHGLSPTHLAKLRTYFTPYPRSNLRLLLLGPFAIPGYVADLLVTTSVLGPCLAAMEPRRPKNLTVLRPLPSLHPPVTYRLLLPLQLRHSTEVIVLMWRLLTRQRLT